MFKCVYIHIYIYIYIYIRTRIHLRLLLGHGVIPAARRRRREAIRQLPILHDLLANIYINV